VAPYATARPAPGTVTGARWTRTARQLLSELALPLRLAVLVGAGAGVVGGAVGLAIGLRTYVPTAWFAVLEIGVPAAVLGCGLGAIGGSLTLLVRRRHGPSRAGCGTSR